MKSETITMTIFVWKQEVKKEYYQSGCLEMTKKITQDTKTNGKCYPNPFAYGVQMKQQNYDEFDSGIPNSFAIGEGFSRKFSMDIVQNKIPVILTPFNEVPLIENQQNSFSI